MSLIEVILKNKRFTKDAWATNNPILAESELGFESDTLNFKIGDGVSRWNELEYVSCNVAFKLANNRKIGNAVFDNTKDITLEEIGALSNDGGYLVGSIFLGTTDDYYINNTGAGAFKELAVDNLTVKSALNIDTDSISFTGNTYFGDEGKYLISNLGKALFKDITIEGNGTIKGTLNTGSINTGNIILKENSQFKMGNEAYINYLGDALLNSVHIHSDLEVDSDVVNNAVTYFGGSTYYIDESGNGCLSSLEVSGIIKAGGIDAPIESAKKLDVPVKIGKADFDGTKGLSASEIGFVPADGGTFTGPVKMSADPSESMEIATKQYVDNHTSGSSYMVLKGTIGVEGNIQALPTSNVRRGDTYRAVNAGVYGPFRLKIGDAISALADSEDGVEFEVNETNWTKISANTELENYRVKASNTENSNLVENDFTTGDIILGLAATKHVTDNDNKTLLMANDTNLVTARAVVNHLRAALGDTLDTITSGTVITGTQYFGEDKTYYIDNTGSSRLNRLDLDGNLTVAGNINVTGPDCLISGLVTRARGDINGNLIYSSYASSLGFDGNYTILYAKDGATELSRVELEYAKRAESTDRLSVIDAKPDAITRYNVPMLNSNGTAFTNSGIASLVSAGNADRDGYSKIVLGNDKAIGEAENAYGGIRLYGKGNKYVDLVFEGLDIEDNITVKIPSSSGTLITGGDGTSFSAPVSFSNGISFGSNTDYVIDGEGNARFNQLVVDGNLILKSNINELGNHYFGETTDYYINNNAEAKFKALEVELNSVFNKDAAFKGITKFGEKTSINAATETAIFENVVINNLSELNNKLKFKYNETKTEGEEEITVEYYIDGLTGTGKFKKLLVDTVEVDEFIPVGDFKLNKSILFGDRIDGVQYGVDNTGVAQFNSMSVRNNAAFDGDAYINHDALLSVNSNIYFAGGKDYYVNKNADAKVKSITTTGKATIENATDSMSSKTGAVKVKGGLGVEKSVSAKQFRIGDNAVMYYDNINKCIKFRFEDTSDIEVDPDPEIMIEA